MKQEEGSRIQNDPDIAVQNRHDLPRKFRAVSFQDVFAISEVRKSKSVVIGHTVLKLIAAILELCTPCLPGPIRAWAVVQPRDNATATGPPIQRIEVQPLGRVC